MYEVLEAGGRPGPSASAASQFTLRQHHEAEALPRGPLAQERPARLCIDGGLTAVCSRKSGGSGLWQ